MSLTAERLISLILLLSFLQANGQHKQKLHIEKEPAWITVTNVDYANNLLDIEAEEGAVNLVFEKQIFISGNLFLLKDPSGCFQRPAFKTILKSALILIRFIKLLPCTK
jgi:hypothetical protein